MERPEIVELLFSTLFAPNDIEPLSRFLSQRVEWILSAADRKTLGEEFLSKCHQVFRQAGLSRVSTLFP
jgi:hypothetical protein